MSKYVNEDYIFNSQVTFNVLPNKNVQKSINETIILVTNIHVIKLLNVGAITVTNFKGGAEGQTIRVKGDSNTTVQNGTYIWTNGGFDKLLLDNRVYSFTLIDSIWWEAE